MKSMTAYAEIQRPLESGQLRLALRSVNHKSLDLSLRLPAALHALDPAIRAEVRGAASRGKLDLAVDVQDEPGLEPHKFGERAGLGAAFVFRPALVIERHLDVFHHGELLDKVVGLENKTQPRATHRREVVIWQL